MKSKKSLLTTVVAVIILFGVVALANPTNFFSNVITSVKSVFSAETKTETNHDTKPLPQVATYLQPTPETNNQPNETVPEQVLWRVIFSFPVKFEKSAEEARQKGENDSLWTNFFTRQAKLSESDTTTFKEIAIQHEQEMQTLNQIMRNLMLEIRRQGLQKDETKRKEIIQLQNEKDETTLRFRDNFKNAISEESYIAFEKWLNEDFSKGFARRKALPKDGQKTTYEETAGQGFKRIEQNNNKEEIEK